jgi:hypothetical protein
MLLFLLFLSSIEERLFHLQRDSMSMSMSMMIDPLFRVVDCRCDELNCFFFLTEG